MRKFLSINDGFSDLKIYEIINECFDRKYKSFRQAWYDINDEYGAWFPIIYNEDDVPKESYKYKNVLYNDNKVILEQKIDESPDTIFKSKYDKKRLTFARINGKFCFIGVYIKVKNYKGLSYYENKYERISTAINLETLECFDISLSKEYISGIEKISNLIGEEKNALVKVRANQGKIRENALKKYSNRCAICGMKIPSLLVASHIKAWADSEDREKGDADNVLLLCPAHDALFDKHFISFSDEGKIIISDILDETDRHLLNVNENMEITVLPKMVQYLQYHRNLLKKKE